MEVLAVLGHEPLDEVYLLEGDLDGVLVLGAAGGVGHPQLGPHLAPRQAGDVRVRPLRGRPGGHLGGGWSL